MNYALHVVAITQLRYPCDGRQYFDRKRAEGKNTKEAIRALKRQLSNVIYRTPIADAPDSSSDRQAREDNQERHEIQRDRLNILNGRLFGSVTPGPNNQPYDPASGNARGSRQRARRHLGNWGLTQRGFEPWRGTCPIAGEYPERYRVVS